MNLERRHKKRNICLCWVNISVEIYSIKLTIIFIAKGELIGAFVSCSSYKSLTTFMTESSRVSPNLIMVQTLQGWKLLQKKLTADSFLMEAKHGFPMPQ